MNVFYAVVQQYMGDRKASTKQREAVPSMLIQKALNHPQLRDELYAQLCKQTTANTNLTSLLCGWELMCTCLYYFPPNNAFRDHLFGYLTARHQFCKNLERKLTTEILRPAISVDESVVASKNPAPPGSSSANMPRKFAGSVNSNSSAGSSLQLAQALALGSDPSSIPVKSTNVVSNANSNSLTSGVPTSTSSLANSSFFNKAGSTGSSRWSRIGSNASTETDKINGSQSSGLNQVGATTFAVSATS
ncbi:Rho GTPase activating protein 39 [Cichlidogyrus casuarinus]|uniref:Rho GTPase activating protein 39 n=1 Tax=Cichlidogyrus casuarinus TaxID=1844966 RepID=A0ABD2Q726_9PLAT